MNYTDLTESNFIGLSETDFINLAEESNTQNNQLITPDQYLEFATLYGEVKASVDSIYAPLYDALQIVFEASQYDPEVDLFNVFNNTYVYATTVYNNYRGLFPAVKALNRHIINRGKYTSVDAYISMNNFQVPQTWVDLCASTGVTISPSNIL